jgi:hypothetical protein
MQATFVAWYNFCRKHESPKSNTPAVANALSDYPWAIKELLVNAAEV